MSERAPSPQSIPTPGRRVVLAPTPPGFRRIMVGLVVALLAPFFGILIGSGIGEGDGFTSVQPMYWGFFTGGLIGAAALLVAASGVRALWRSNRTRPQQDPREQQGQEE